MVKHCCVSVKVMSRSEVFHPSCAVVVVTLSNGLYIVISHRTVYCIVCYVLPFFLFHSVVPLRHFQGIESPLSV